MRLVNDSPQAVAETPTAEAGPLTDRRFVILGDGRLARAVDRHLSQRQATVTTRPIYGPTREADLAIALEGAECVLVLSEDHEANLRAALLATEMRPELPVVIRAFDPALADEIERDRPGGPLRVRRAYSMSHLAAPHFVAAALLGEGEDILSMLRIGEDYVVACRLRLRSERGSRSRRLAGMTPAGVLRRHGCQVIARRPAEGPWAVADQAPLADGDEIVLGGRLVDVLHVARRRSRVGRHRPPRPRTGGVRRRRDERPLGTRIAGLWAQATTRSMQVLGALLVLVTSAVALTSAGGAAGSFYAWVLTALGNPARELQGASPVDAVVGGVGLLAGGVALGLAISLMSAYFIDRRLTETSFRRARFLRNHVIVVGLGDVGLRTSQLLDRLGVPFSVVDPSVGAVAETVARAGRHIGGAPVLIGNLAESLDAAGVGRAAAVIACGEKNLLNVEACMRAKRLSSARTVARIFDDDDAERCAEMFGVDRRLAAVEAAAPVFADAAVHEEAIRSFGGSDAPMVCLRWPSGCPLGRRQMEGWHGQGVRLLAVWRHGEGARPPGVEPSGLAEEEAGVLAGPASAMEGVLEELRRRTGAAPRRTASSRP